MTSGAVAAADDWVHCMEHAPPCPRLQPPVAPGATKSKFGASMHFPSKSFAATCLLFAFVLQAHATPDQDRAAVAALDTKYQAAVKANDAATMDSILADDFVLVTGKGKTFNKADLLKAARDKTETYEHQEDSEQTVRVWGDTAVVTALLWIKGSNKDGAYEYKLWFSDTYARAKNGWRYVFGQASMRLTP
jgi:ketosteroid isomerase-like protein